MARTHFSGGGEPGHVAGIDIDPERLDQQLTAVQLFLRRRRAGQLCNARVTDAWRDFYTACTALFLRCGDVATLSVEEREDCLQDCWLAVIGVLQAPVCPPATNRFASWLRGLAHNKATDIRRRGAVRTKAIARYASRRPAPAIRTPTERLAQAEETLLVHTALEQLNASSGALNHAIIVLRYFDSKRCAAIATQLDLTPAQVRQRMVRARAKLRALRQRIDRDESRSIPRG